MKWYSVKKYTPPSDCTYIIRVELPSSNINYEQYLIANREVLGEVDSLSSWIVHDIALDSSEQWQEYKVTHFAIIDPVEIE
ncbi:MAG TPA: hypothetical protein VKR58_09670 [Aquella sp.]|nr:hypothetical protein [Aquella sp.]